MRAILFTSFLFFMIWSTAQIRKGDSLMNLGDYTQATKAYENAPRSARKFFKMARAADAIGDIMITVQLFQKGLEIDSLDVRARFEYGKALYRNTQPMDSYIVLRNLILEFPNVEAYYFEMGKSMLVLEQQPVLKAQLENEAIDSAESAFAKALQINPQYRKARIELLKLQIKQRKNIQAIFLAEEALETQPNDIKILSLAAQAAMGAKAYGKAIGYFEQLQELGNDTAYNCKNMALAYYRTDEWENALEHYNAYINQYDDKDAEVYFMISVIYNRLEQPKKGIKELYKAIELKSPPLHQEYLQMASIYAGMKDNKNAYFFTRKANEENPKNFHIAYQLALAADYYFEDNERKLSAYEKFVKDHPETQYTEMAKARLRDLRRMVFLDEGKE